MHCQIKWPAFPFIACKLQHNTTTQCSIHKLISFIRFFLEILHIELLLVVVLSGMYMWVTPREHSWIISHVEFIGKAAASLEKMHVIHYVQLILLYISPSLPVLCCFLHSFILHSLVSFIFLLLMFTRIFIIILILLVLFYPLFYFIITYKIYL